MSKTYVKLGDVCEVQNGFAFDSKCFSSTPQSGMPLIRIRDILRGWTETYYTGEYNPDYIVRKGDFLIGMDGDFNIGQWKSDDALLNQRVCRLIPSEKINVKFLYYYLPTELQKINDDTTYATVKHLSSKQVKSIRIPQLTLSEQQYIVDILDAEFAKIDALKENAEKNLQNAKDLFQAVLRKELEPKKGWKTSKLGDVSDIARGGSPRPIKAFLTNNSDGINWIKIGDTEMGGKYITETKEKILPEGMRYSRHVKSGDFLLSNSMSFGRPYILKIDGCIHDGWLVIRNYQSHFTQDYLYYLLSSPIVVKQFEESARGATVRNLNTDIVANVSVSYPTIEEQYRVVDNIEKLNLDCIKLRENYAKTLDLCNDLKQALLRKAFNGEL